MLEDKKREINSIDENFKRGKGSYTSPKNIASGLKEAEEKTAASNNSRERANEGGLKELTPGPGFVNKTSPIALDSRGRLASSVTKMSGKKKTIIGGSLGVIGLLIASAMMFFTSMLGIRVGEIFTDSLDDASAGISRRQAGVIRTRLGGLHFGLCSSGISIRCRFSSTSNKQVKSLKRAGIEVDCGSGFGNCSSKIGRNKVKAYKFEDGTVISDPAKLKAHMRDNPKIKSQMHKALNSKYYSVSNRVARSVLRRMGLSKANLFKGKDTKGIRDKINEVTNRNGANELKGIETTATDEVDADGNKLLKDSQGNLLTEADVDVKNSSIKQSLESIRSVKGFGGAVKAIGLVGHLDTACSVYKTTRAVSLMAKTIRSARLGGFAMSIINISSSIKAGEADPEQSEYLGNIFTEVDTRKTVGQDDNGVPLTNPDYGKSATDSAIWKLAQNGEVPNENQMSTSLSSFMVGGAGAGILDGIYKMTKQLLAGVNPREACKVVQSTAVRLGSTAIGLGLTFVSGGVSAIGGAALKSAAIMGAFMVGMGYLESMIAEQAEDIDINSLARYSDLTGALYAGLGSIMGPIAAGNGASPITEESLSYMNTRVDYQKEKVAILTEEAKKTPFDVSNQYSFLGSTARKAAVLAANKNNLMGKLATIPKLIVETAVPKAFAVENTFDEKQLNMCQDEDYKELGIKADVMCNVRYGWTDAELEMDTNEVVDFMINNEHIDDNAAENAEIAQVAKSDTFKKYLEYCAFREIPYGEQGLESDWKGQGGEDDWTVGKNCLGTGADVDRATLSNFRMFTADYSVIQTMDEDIESDEASSSESSAVNGTKRELAQKILDSQNVQMASDVESHLKDIASSGVGNAWSCESAQKGCGINIYILRIIATLSDKYKFYITSLNRARIGSTVGGISSVKSRHYNGNGSAVDLANIDDVPTNGRDAGSQKAIKEIMPLLVEASEKSGAGTWSGIGQQGCGSLETPLGAGVRQFNDGCNHLHLDVDPLSDADLVTGGEYF